MKVEITINGVAFPCKPTMGAMLRFKQETGREVTEINGFSDLCIYLWCCIVSACSARDYQGEKFDLTLMEFADSVSPDDMAVWYDSIAKEATGSEAKGTEKKS